MREGIQDMVLTERKDPLEDKELNLSRQTIMSYLRL